MASGAAQVISSLIGAAGAAAPTVAAAINQRKAEREGKKLERQAAYDAGNATVLTTAPNPRMIDTTAVVRPAQQGLPTWAKIALGVGGVVAVGGVGVWIFRQVGSGKKKRRR